MEKLEFEMMVTEQRFEREAGRWPKSRATLPGEFAFFDGGKVAVEGDLTFHGLNVPIGQNLKVEVTLVEAPPPEQKVRRDFRTNQPITD